MIVLAAPVSTRTSEMFTDVPAYVSVAVTNARSCRNVSCTKTSDSQPETFLEYDLGVAGVDKAELAVRLRSLQLATTLHRSSTIAARFDHCDAIEDAVIVRAMRLERLDHEPLIGMRCADLTPQHAP